MLTVHLRITDAATGRPTPVRLRVTGPDGGYLSPHGRLAEFAAGRNEDVGGHLRAGRENWCYVDGTCEVKLPAGVPVRIRALKGPEYTPLDQTVVLGPGQLALRLTVERWSDVRAAGWVPGDVRAHFLSPHAAALEAAAEDLDVVHLLARAQQVAWLDGHVYDTLPNMTAFSGQHPALPPAPTAVAVNTLNAHPVLGAVGLLHCHRPVFPLTFGGPEETDDWSVSDWCDQCRRKGGLAVWVDPFAPLGGVPGGEALVALLLGKVDAVEADGRPRKQPLQPGWYRLLNAGAPVPLVGGSGKDSNAVPLGYPRTYANLGPGEPVTLGGWVEAVRAGRCYATNGPLLAVEAAGRGPGEAVDVPAAGAPVPVRATAASGWPFDKLEVVADGQVVAAAAATAAGPRWAAAVEWEHRPAESGWLAARCSGGKGSGLAPDQQAFAHTSPVVVRVAGRPLPRRPAAVAPLRQAVEQTRDWVDLHGRFTDPKAKRHLLDLCDQALARLAAPVG